MMRYECIHECSDDDLTICVVHGTLTGCPASCEDYDNGEQKND